MKVWLCFALLWIVALPAFAGSPGSFAGTVVRGPESPDTWLYIQGHNHRVRRVWVGEARFEYDSDVPAVERKKPVPTALPPGTKVRVMAEQDEAGEWRATEVQILAAPPDEKKSAAPTTSQS
jgi:hypothetical protein